MKKIKTKLAQAITMIAMTMATPAYSQTSGLVTVEGNFAYPGTLWGWSSDNHPLIVDDFPAPSSFMKVNSCSSDIYNERLAGGATVSYRTVNLRVNGVEQAVRLGTFNARNSSITFAPTDYFNPYTTVPEPEAIRNARERLGVPSMPPPSVSTRQQGSYNSDRFDVAFISIGQGPNRVGFVVDKNENYYDLNTFLNSFPSPSSTISSRASVPTLQPISSSYVNSFTGNMKSLRSRLTIDLIIMYMERICSSGSSGGSTFPRQTCARRPSSQYSDPGFDMGGLLQPSCVLRYFYPNEARSLVIMR